MEFLANETLCYIAITFNQEVDMMIGSDAEWSDQLHNDNLSSWPY